MYIFIFDHGRKPDGSITSEASHSNTATVSPTHMVAIVIENVFIWSLITTHSEMFYCISKKTSMNSSYCSGKLNKKSWSVDHIGEQQCLTCIFTIRGESLHVVTYWKRFSITFLTLILTCVQQFNKLSFNPDACETLRLDFCSQRTLYCLLVQYDVRMSHTWRH